MLSERDPQDDNRRVRIFLCPGQGAQKPGFLTEWLADEATMRRARHYSEVLGIDLVRFGTVSDANTIRDTAIAQPLIVAAGLLSFHRLQDAGLVSPQADLGFAGHSVGEVTVAALAGILTEEEALQFVGERSRLMAIQAAQTPTSMAAVVGGRREDVLAAISAHDLSPVNFNSSRQVVAAGTIPNIEGLVGDAPRGCRVIPLSVAGAFHSSYMRGAVEPLREFSRRLSPSDPIATVWSNRTGATMTSGSEFVNAMIEQVASPVHWEECMAGMAAVSPEAFIELLPGGTLVGLAKHEVRGVPGIALRTVEDLATVEDTLSERAGVAR